MRFRLVIAMLVLPAAGLHAASLRAGINLARLLVDPLPSGSEVDFRPGFHLSVVKDFPQAYGATFVGIGFEQRGTRHSLSQEDALGIGAAYTSEAEVTLGYLTVPIGIQFENRQRRASRGYLALRLAPSKLMSAEREYSESGEDDYGDEYENSGTEDIMDDMREFDMMAEIEAGLSIPAASGPVPAPGTEGRRWLVGAALGYGLFDILDVDLSEDGGAPEWKSLLLRAYVGMTF
jgi:hypothetical protein